MNQTTGAPRFDRLSARELRFAEKPAIDPSDGRRDRTEKRAASADRPARSDRLLRVIGGNSFAHRSYHALPKTIRRSDGKGAGAILGFANLAAVAVGSPVTILRDDDRRQTFRIVREDEADPRGGSIAYVSPLAHHLSEVGR